MLAAIVRGKSLFPLEIPFKRLTAREIAQQFGAVMDWVAALQADSSAVRGFGYELRYERIANRVHGRNDLPVAAVFPTEEDALRYIGRDRDARRARRLIEMTMTRFPVLEQWLARRALVMLKHASEWEGVLAVLEWFVANPRPNVYMRQLEIPSVDTKFIETHRALLMELLDIVLPTDAINPDATGVRGFARRYGLRDEPPTIRFRILDPQLYIRGLTDLTVPADEFARLELLPGQSLPLGQHLRVFITENRINGLTLPSLPGSIVIFGLGYAVEQLVNVPWLHEADVWYWGDIDTHGFGILNRLRAHLRHVRSLLMDRDTLEAHRSLWVQEPEDRRYTVEPKYLLPDEYSLFDDLRHDRLGPRVRLEQERISFTWVQRALARLRL